MMLLLAPSPALHHIRSEGYTLEQEFCCGCRVATVVGTLPLLKLAETSMPFFSLIFYVQQLIVLVLSITTINFTVVLSHLHRAPVYTHSHIHTPNRHACKVHSKILGRHLHQVGSMRVERNEMKSRITGEMQLQYSV